MKKRAEETEKREFYYIQIGGKVQKIKPMDDGSYLIYSKTDSAK